MHTTEIELGLLEKILDFYLKEQSFPDDGDHLTEVNKLHDRVTTAKGDT